MFLSSLINLVRDLFIVSIVYILSITLELFHSLNYLARPSSVLRRLKAMSAI